VLLQVGSSRQRSHLHCVALHPAHLPTYLRKPERSCQGLVQRAHAPIPHPTPSHPALPAALASTCGACLCRIAGSGTAHGHQHLDQPYLLHGHTRHARRRRTLTPTPTPLQYRTARNYACFDYLAARLFDKVIFALIVMSLYFGTGSNFATDNTPNLAALMYLCIAQPAWGAVAFIPAIVMGAPQPACLCWGRGGGRCAVAPAAGA
jgi:hypothetical protein